MLSFVNIIFLAGIAAASVPVILHLVRNVKARQVPFSTLMFLSATEDQIVKRRKLQDAALMAIRAAIVALLALVFARPFLPDNAIPFLGSADNVSHVILIDNSYSMSTSGLFESAKSEVVKMVEEANPNDEFAVVVFSDRPQQLTTFDAERNLHTSAVNAQEIVFRTTDFYEPLRLAEEILQDARYDDQMVTLVSDFQRVGWSGALENWNLPAGVNFVTQNIHPADRSNHYLEDVRVSQQRVQSARSQSVALRFDVIPVRSNDSSPATVTLELDGEEVAVEPVSDLERSRITFQATVPSTGMYRVVVRMNDDDLEVDNRTYITVDVKDKPSILVIGGRSRTPYDDAFFLGKVFDLGERGLYKFQSQRRGSITSGTLRGHTLVVIANVSALTTGEVDVINGWVESGGHLMISQGDAVDISRVSGVLSKLGIGTSAGIVNAQREIGDNSIVGEVDERHPIFAPLAATGGVILRPEFRRYLRVVPDSSSNIVAYYDSGDPFLIERKRGAGSVLVHTSTINNSWTNFPVDELFVPLMYQIAAYASDASSRNRQFVVGEAVALPGVAGQAWRVRTPSGAEYSVESSNTTAASTQNNIFFRETDEPGHYLAVRGTERYPFSVNVDRKESDLTARDDAEAYAAVASPFVEQDVSVQIAGKIQKNDARQSLWPLLLCLVVGLLGLETLVANKKRGGR